MDKHIKHASSFFPKDFVVPFDLAALHFEMFPKDFLDKALDMYHSGKLRLEYQRDDLMRTIKAKNWSKNRKTMACKFVNFLYYLRQKVQRKKALTET